jgi:hypothetical protein
MADPLGQLEDRVARVLDRLEGIGRERDALRQEVGQLRERLESLEAQQARLEGPARAASEGWRRERARIAETLRDTLHGLRRDPPGVGDAFAADRVD